MFESIDPDDDAPYYRPLVPSAPYPSIPSANPVYNGVLTSRVVIGCMTLDEDTRANEVGAVVVTPA